MTQVTETLMGMGVPCEGFKAWNGSDAPCRATGDYNRVQKDECPCQGSGLRYPLRLPCPKCAARVGGEDMGWEKCHQCNNAKNVFNPDPDALWDAVRANGGTLRAWIDGDQFVSECRLGSPMNEPRVAKAGTSSEAIQTAVARALEKEDQHD